MLVYIISFVTVQLYTIFTRRVCNNVTGFWPAISYKLTNKSTDVNYMNHTENDDGCTKHTRLPKSRYIGQGHS